MGPMLSRHIPRLVLRVFDMLLLWLKICNLSYYVLGNPVFYWPWQWWCWTWCDQSHRRSLARFVTRNYHDRHPGSVTQMVQQLQWEPLQVRRVKIRLVLLYKIQHGLVAIPAETYLVAGDTRTRGENKFCPPNVRKDVTKRYTQVHAVGKTKNSECYVQLKTWLLYIYMVWTPSWYPVSVFSWFLKPSSKVAQATCGGSLFQSPMVHGISCIYSVLHFCSVIGGCFLLLTLIVYFHFFAVALKYA
jgi:hypothetical protein